MFDKSCRIGGRVLQAGVAAHTGDFGGHAIRASVGAMPRCYYSRCGCDEKDIAIRR